MTDNVINSADRFAKKREEDPEKVVSKSEEQMIRDMVDNMQAVYDNCTPAVEAAIELLIAGLLKAGYKPSDFSYEDYMLLRESMFSMVMRSRELFHPLQTVAHTFEKLVTDHDNH